MSPSITNLEIRYVTTANVNKPIGCRHFLIFLVQNKVPSRQFALRLRVCGSRCLFKISAHRTSVYELVCGNSKLYFK
jgi:hypothetical protein